MSKSKKELRELIASKESEGDYNVLVGGDTANLTELTVRDILELQDHMAENDYKSTAVGKYQMIKSTVESLLYVPGTTELRNPTDFNLDTKFDEKTQDWAADALIDRRMAAAGDTAEALGMPVQVAEALELSKEWASLPDPRTNKSYYDGDGLNASHHKIGDVYRVLGGQR
jgi:muramidase (phage lysozyme)